MRLSSVPTCAQCHADAWAASSISRSSAVVRSRTESSQARLFACIAKYRCQASGSESVGGRGTRIYQGPENAAIVRQPGCGFAESTAIGLGSVTFAAVSQDSDHL